MRFGDGVLALLNVVVDKFDDLVGVYIDHVIVVMV